MKAQESQFNEANALQVVDEMISLARNKIDDNGFLFLLWGWIITLGQILGFIWHSMGKELYIGLSFGGLSTIGMIVTIVYLVKSERKKTVTTYLDNFISYLWGGFFISLVIFHT